MQLKQELQQKGWAQFLLKGKSSIFQYLKTRYFYLRVRSPGVKDLIPRLSHAISQDQHRSTSCKHVCTTRLRVPRHGAHPGAPGTSLGASLLQGSPGLQGRPLPMPAQGLPGALDLQGPSATGSSAGGTIYLVNFGGRRFNCFKLPLEKLEWSTINQADLPPRAHPPRAGNRLPPRDLLLMNFAALLISRERRSPAEHVGHRCPGQGTRVARAVPGGTERAAQPAQLSLPSRTGRRWVLQAARHGPVKG